MRRDDSEDEKEGHSKGGRRTGRGPVDGVTLRPTHVKTAVAILAAFVIVWAFSRLPLPEVSQLREWSSDLGPWFVVAFFVAYSTIPVLPVPRTAFTYSAAFLFPPEIAIPLSLGGVAVSSSIAFWVGRRFGYSRLTNFRANPRIRILDEHLARRGWAAVLSLRMVPAVPFAVLNFAAALSSIRFFPYLAATVAGSAPNTVAVILLGESVSTGSGAGMTWALVGIAGLGVLGLLIEGRLLARGPRPAVAGDVTAPR